MAGNTPMISPGVRINLVDESLYTPSTSLPDNTKAEVIIGAAQYGRFNVPIAVSSVPAYEMIFGTPIDIAGLTAINSIRNGGTVYYMRFGDEVSAKAMTCELGDLTLNATAKGTLREGSWIARVTAIESNTTDFILEIINKDASGNETSFVASAAVSLSSESENYYANWNNSYFELTASSEGDPTQLPTAGDKEITAGTNGLKDLMADNATYVNTALDVISDRDSYTFMYGFVPLYSSIPTVAAKIVEVSNLRKDAVFQIDHPTTETDTTMTNANAAEKIATFAKTYVGATNAWVAFWAVHEGYIVNPYQNNAQVLAPASAFIAPAIAAEYATNFNWRAPAGANNLAITNFVALNKVWTQAERDTLYAANVNPVLNYKGLGYTAMGQKSGQTRNTAMNRLNVVQLYNYVKLMSEEMSADFLFAPIDDETFNAWKSRESKILTNIKQNHGLYDFLIKLDWETVTSDDIANNRMPAIVKIKPTRIAEFIDVDLVIKNYSDTL